MFVSVLSVTLARDAALVHRRVACACLAPHALARDAAPLHRDNRICGTGRPPAAHARGWWRSTEMRRNSFSKKKRKHDLDLSALPQQPREPGDKAARERLEPQLFYDAERIADRATAASSIFRCVFRGQLLSARSVLRAAAIEYLQRRAQREFADAHVAGDDHKPANRCAPHRAARSEEFSPSCQLWSATRTLMSTISTRPAGARSRLQ